VASVILGEHRVTTLLEQTRQGTFLKGGLGR